MLIVLATFLISNGYSPELCKEISKSLDTAVNNNTITKRQAKSLYRNCLRKATKQAG